MPGTYGRDGKKSRYWRKQKKVRAQQIRKWQRAVASDHSEQDLEETPKTKVYKPI